MSLKKEIAAYEGMRTDLEGEHLGKWALVHNEELTGIFESFEQAAEDSSRTIRPGALSDSPDRSGTRDLASLSSVPPSAAACVRLSAAFQDRHPYWPSPARQFWCVLVLTICTGPGQP